MVLSSNLQTAILRYFGESASACPDEITIKCQTEAPRKAPLSVASCKDFPVFSPSSPHCSACDLLSCLAQQCSLLPLVWPARILWEGGKPHWTPASWCHLVPLYLQGPFCSYRLLQEENSLCDLSSFEGQHRENFFDILGFRPGLLTHPRCVIFWGVNATSCRKPSCVDKAKKKPHQNLTGFLSESSWATFHGWEINHYYTSQDRALLISPVSVEKKKKPW